MREIEVDIYIYIYIEEKSEGEILNFMLLFFPRFPLDISKKDIPYVRGDAG